MLTLTCITLLIALHFRIHHSGIIKIPLKKSLNVHYSHRRLPSIAYNSVPLGRGLGTHYAELHIGLPPQRASVILDTGSEITAIPCTECVTCGSHTDPLFNLSQSTSVRFTTCQEYQGCTSCSSQRCQIFQSYTEGSYWEAFVINDLVWVGGFSVTDPRPILERFGIRFSFGCQTNENGMFITQKENGIMGLGRSSQTIIHAMLKAKRIERHTFSLCFGDKGGSFVIGGIDYSNHHTKVSYTPLLPHASHYKIELRDVRINNHSIGINPLFYASDRGTIVDSGTTNTYLPQAAEKAFAKLYEKVSGVRYATEDIELNGKAVEALPKVSFVLKDLEGALFELELDNAKIIGHSGSAYAGTLFFTERSGAGMVFVDSGYKAYVELVIGANVMMGYDVVFDMQESRVGFARADCGM